MLRRASGGSHDTENKDHMSQEEGDQTGHDQGNQLPASNKKDSNMEILVMQFLKNSIVNNPIIVSSIFIFILHPSFYCISVLAGL